MGGGGGEFHSNLRCRDIFSKIVTLLKNCRSEGSKSIHFWKGLCTGFSTKSKIITIGATGKKLQWSKSRICNDICAFA